MLNEINILLARALDEANPDQNIKTLVNYDSAEDSQCRLVVNLLNSKFSSAFNAALNDHLILRGTSNKGSVALGIPGTRVSQHTTNIYTRLMSDVLPSWKNYPKRNHSFICTASWWKSRDYRTNRYLMLPANGSKIGICDNTDIWNSFYNLRKFGIDGMQSFNEQLTALISLPVVLNMDYWHEHEQEYPALRLLYNTIEINSRISLDTYFKQKSVKEILQLFTDFENLCRNSVEIKREMKETTSKFREILLKRIIDKNEHLIAIFNDALSPEANNFKLVSIEEYGSIEKNTTSEMWTDGECLMIDLALPGYYGYYMTALNAPVKEDIDDKSKMQINLTRNLIKYEPKLIDLFNILTIDVLSRRK